MQPFDTDGEEIEEGDVVTARLDSFSPCPAVAERTNSIGDEGERNKWASGAEYYCKLRGDPLTHIWVCNENVIKYSPSRINRFTVRAYDKYFHDYSLTKQMA